LAEMSEPEERGIRDYVKSQKPPDSDGEVSLVQKVGRRRVGATTHELYDVWMSSGSRWWVITHHTNLYSQNDFQSLGQAFTYHLGLMRVVAEQFKVQPDEIQAEFVSKPWRRFARASEAMSDADEAEDYQAVGIRCREALIALAREYQDADWVRVVSERPKVADAKGWMRIYADSLTTGRPRDYMRALVDKTWDLAVWLQHYTDATEWDAQLLLDATAQFLNTFTLLMVRHEHGSEARCPQCDSYQLMEDNGDLIEHNGHYGMWLHDVCLSCGWKSEKRFDQWSAERLRRLIDYHIGE
jgi:hypothetical protein